MRESIVHTVQQCVPIKRILLINFQHTTLDVSRKHIMLFTWTWRHEPATSYNYNMLKYVKMTLFCCAKASSPWLKAFLVLRLQLDCSWPAVLKFHVAFALDFPWCPPSPWRFSAEGCETSLGSEAFTCSAGMYPGNSAPLFTTMH